MVADLRANQAAHIVDELLTAAQNVLENATQAEPAEHVDQMMVGEESLKRLQRAVHAAQRFARRIVV